MKLLVFILSVIIFIKTLSYGLFELKYQNKIGGAIVVFVSIVSLLFPNIMVYIKGV